MPAASPTPVFDDLQQPIVSIGRLLKQVFNSLVRNIDAKMQPFELTAMQWEPLLILAIGKADTVAELARESHVNAGAMTRMLDRLECKQLLRRRRSESDRRVVHLELTDKGRQAAQAIPAVVVEEITAHVQGFTPQELSTLTNLLERMLANGRPSSLQEDTP